LEFAFVKKTSTVYLNQDIRFTRLALRLGRRAYGKTSPNPMVGAVLVKAGRVIGWGWHRAAGQPHAEIEAIRQAHRRGQNIKGATLYVTLEPCCSQGRTPPCTKAIIEAQIKRVVTGASDPNPRHQGRGYAILRRAGIQVTGGVLQDVCEELNPGFNHWIVHRTPLVTVKAAMTLDGKIATAGGESKWITSEASRAYAMKLREGTDAILVGINTVLADDPSLTIRNLRPEKRTRLTDGNREQPQRIVLDALARTPLNARVVTDTYAARTTIVVSNRAPKSRVSALAKRVRVVVGASIKSSTRSFHPILDLSSILKKLGAENITSLLVEGGGEVNAAFLLQGLAQRISFFYAPKVLGGRDSIPAVGGDGVASLNGALRLTRAQWRKLGPDLLLTAQIAKTDERPRP
jgi:diaminohydroxyphosphoribosylaminopyrimidine deaminase/5-amino-6-(5-phosphoribosylamino)uracil reductase